MNYPQILIVDDELPARQRLIALLEDIHSVCPHTLAGQAVNAREALLLMRELQPDIVLLDVQMPEMNGMELAHQMQTLDGGCPEIIFVTAYDNFAVNAFEVGASDYLLKPVRAIRLQEAIQRAMQRLNRRDVPEQRQYFTVVEKDQIWRVPVTEVLFLKADQKYVSLHTAHKEYLIEASLNSLEREFGKEFLRVHRSVLVARNAIAGVARALHMTDEQGEEEKVTESWELIVSGSTQRLPVSRRQWPLVKEMMRHRGNDFPA